MIVNVIIFSCFSKSIVDIGERTFVSGTKHFNNQWEYGGYTTYDTIKNRFELVPGDRYSEGFVWLSNRLPRKNWSIRTVFEFSLDSNLNNFGIWITSRFGPTGEVFGGPMSFIGVAILIKYSSGKLEIEVRQNDGKDSYNPIVFVPQFSAELKHPKISLNVSYSSDNNLNIRLFLHQSNLRKSGTHQKILYENNEFISKNQTNLSSDITSEEFVIFEGKPVVSLSHFWLGVTSYNPKDGKPLFLKSIRIKGLKSKFTKLNTTLNQKAQRTLISMLNQTNITNQQLIEKIEKIEKSKSLSNLNVLIDYKDIIECIEVLVNTSNKMLRQKLLTRVTQSQTIQYAETWQRRTLTATNDLKFLKETVKNEMSLIEQEISMLNYNVFDTFKKFHREIIELTDELILSYEQELNIGKKELNEIEGNILRSFLLYITIIEIIIILIFCPYLLLIRAKSR